MAVHMENHFSSFASLGYERLVPIVPPGAEVSEKSLLAKRPGSLGKAVGVKGGDGSWHGIDWVHMSGPNKSQLAEWAKMGAGVGIRTGVGIVALDIDSLDPAISRRAEALALEMLGPAPCRIGRAPKRLLVYAAPAETPYQCVQFTGDSGKNERVELLAEGRQFVASGIHPITKKPYIWKRPLVSLNELTIVTVAQWQVYFKALADKLPAASIVAAGITANDRSKINQDDLKGSKEWVAKAVAALPNNSVFDSRDAYMKVGFALKGASQDWEEEGRELFHSWAERWEDGEYDYDTVESNWQSMKPPYALGAAWLYDMAQQYGSFNKARVYFDVIDDNKETSINAETLKFVPFASLAHTLPKSREWIVKDWIPRGSLTLLAGRGGIGKTLVTQQLSIAVAHGLDWLGIEVKKGPVIGLFCEDDEAELLNRAHRMFIRSAVAPANYEDNLYLSARAGMQNLLVVFSRDASLKPSGLLAEIEAHCVQNKPILLVLDNVAQMFGGDENNRYQVTAFCNALTKIATDHNCAVVLLSHPAKAEESQYSGSTAWEAAVRMRLHMKSNGDGTISLVKEKANYAEQGEIRLELRNGIFVPYDADAQPTQKLLEAEKAIISSLERYIAQKRSCSHRSQASNYLLRMMRDDQFLQGCSESLLKRALSRLIQQRIVVPDTNLWKDTSRHSVRGLSINDPLGITRRNGCGKVA